MNNIDFNKIFCDSVNFCQNHYAKELKDIESPNIFIDFQDWNTHKKLKPIKFAIEDFINQNNIQIVDDVSFNNLLSAICNTRSAAKGAKSGNAFEELIEKILINFGYSVKREVAHEDFSEKLDIFATNNKNTFAIMIQKDVWNGGQQSQRCRKYLDSEKLINYNSKNYKYICLVFNEYIPPKFNQKKKQTQTQAQKDFELIKNAYEQKNIMWVYDFFEYLKSITTTTN